MKLIGKAVVVAEIEKRIKTLNEILIKNPILSSTLEKLIEENKKVLSILDTLEVQEEPVSEDLEEEALVYSASDTITEDGKLVIDSEKVNAFKAGAEWQKQQMKKDAISATIVSDLDPHGADYGNQKIKLGWGELEAKRFNNGSKVKLIIIKED